jgi:glycosyltransferase involved in cell wall biosynthesis
MAALRGHKQPCNHPATVRSLLAVSTIAPWPPLNGHSLRVSHLLDELAARWSITLIAPPCDVPASIARHMPLTLRGSGFTYPWRFDQAGLRGALDSAMRDGRFDRALVWAGAEAPWFGRGDLPRAVVDVIDCNPLEFWRGFLSYHGLRQRYRALREIPVALRYARHTVHSYAATVCVGEADASWLRRIGGRDTVHVVPNGVDVPDQVAAEAALPTMSFTGALDYQPNIEAVLFAADAIWPRVHAAVPDAQFVIAGRDPVPEVRALAARPNVELAANVPSMADVVGHSWVSIAPMRSGVGIKNKVLEAWACARPVVMSRLATNGLVIPPDHARLVSADPQVMAAAVVALFEDAAERHRLGATARANVQQHFTWTGAAARIDALLRL